MFGFLMVFSSCNIKVFYVNNVKTHVEKKRSKTREKSSFSTFGEVVDYVIITQFYLARFAWSCKILARLTSACKKLARIPCFVRNLQDKCKISISSKLEYSLVGYA